MTMNRAARVVVTVTGLLCAPGMALAQTAPPHVPLQKTIGQNNGQASGRAVAVRDEFPGVSLQGGKLTLTGIAPSSIVFADRPVRAAGHD